MAQKNEHRCDKEKQINELTVKMDSLYETINGNGKEGMKVTVARLDERMGVVIKKLDLLSDAVVGFSEFITRFNAAEAERAKRNEEEGDQFDKKDKKTNTWLSLAALLVSAGCLILMIIAFTKGQPL